MKMCYASESRQSHNFFCCNIIFRKDAWAIYTIQSVLIVGRLKNRTKGLRSVWNFLFNVKYSNLSFIMSKPTRKRKKVLKKKGNKIKLLSLNVLEVPMNYKIMTVNEVIVILMMMEIMIVITVVVGHL